jgi:hypothetical protein
MINTNNSDIEGNIIKEHDNVVNNKGKVGIVVKTKSNKLGVKFRGVDYIELLDDNSRRELLILNRKDSITGKTWFFYNDMDSDAIIETKAKRAISKSVDNFKCEIERMSIVSA